MIDIKGVKLKYPDGTLALDDINLQVKDGELVYITGASGAGKTSLLKLIMGMETPTEGTVDVLGHRISEGNIKDIRVVRQRVGPVLQEIKLVQGRTATENVMMGIRFLGFSKRELKANASDALMKVGLLHKAYSMVENLSWGEAQRVAIARAMARNPAIIIADEPTGNLDHDNAVNIFNILSSFQRQGTAVIIATHATHLIENQKNITLIQMEMGKIK